MKRLVTALLALFLVAGCASSDPLGTQNSSTASGTTSKQLVIGSQQYYSNEIVAELFAQALESRGWTIDRQYQIGQREVYLPELAAGRIDVMPEYIGNLLQYYDKQATAKTRPEIVTALRSKVPSGLMLLEPAAASDQDSFNVTAQTAQQYGLKTIGDLAKLPRVTVAANSELAKRPYGPTGLKSAYGVDAEVVPVEDSGGPLTIKALKDGKCDTADIYSADPSIASNNLTTLSDPKSLVLPQNVVPIVSAKVNEAAAAAIDAVDAKLSTEELVQLNALSVTKQQSSAVIAKDWLTAKGLLG